MAGTMLSIGTINVINIAYVALQINRMYRLGI
jgi:hypothetical protein